MKTNLKFPIQPRHPLNLFAGTMLALLFFAPAILAGQGAASYVDWNTTTPGFGTPADTTETALTWSTSAAGTAATTAKPATTQLTIGANLADFAAVSPYAFNIDMNAGSTLQGILINSSNINVTLTGSSNEHNNSSPNTWTITNNSSLTLNDTRQAFDSASTVKGFNWNGVAVTFQGGGTFNFLTPFGCNTATAVQTENMIGGVINLQWPSTISTKSTYCGGFILTNGTLNFASAGSAYVFSGLTNGQTVSINGGTIDNTSGSPLTLVVATLSGNVGGRGYSFGGNFTFTGSSSLDLGTANVTNSVSPTITVSANTLAIGGVISGPGNGLTKIGNGTLQFYGANTYSGNTFVNRGTLALTNGGSIANSPLIVSNATFDVSGLSAATALTSLSISNSTLVIAGLSSTATNIMATTLNPGGTTNIINVTSLPQVTSYPATFHVFKGTTLNGTLNFGLGTLPSASPAFVGYITNRPATASVDLVLTTGPAPVRALTWTGTNAISGLPDGTWDVVTTPTWLDASSAATTFNQLDFVRFDDTAAGQTAVNLTTTLTPSSLIVSNNALSYTFIGNHLADGSSSLTLTKQGTGTLLLQESGDSFSGNIAANGGTVIIDNDSSTITGGTVIGGSGTVQVGTNDTAGVLPSGTVTVNGALVFNRSDNITVANTISGSGTVSQININIVTLSGASSGSWATMITNGTLQAVNNTSLGSVPGGTVTVTNGGTFDVGGNTTQNNANFGSKPFVVSGAGVGGNGAIINSGSVQQQNAFQSITLAADATWGGTSRWDMRGGTPQLNLAGHTLTKISGNQISLVSPHVTSGNIVIQQGILSFETTPTFDASAGTITVNPGGYLAQYRDTAGSYTRSIVLNGGGTTNISGAGQTAILDATITLTANSTIGSSGGTEFFNGVISDGGNGFSVAIVGTGTNIFAATNTFTGITSVQGVAGLTNRGSLASSAVIVITNTGVFDVSGMTIPFSGANALWVGDDTMGQGTFKLGKTLVTNFNYLSISNAVLEMAVINPNVPCITVTNLNLGDNGAASTINVTALPVPAPAQFPLIKYANATGTYNLSIGTLPAGYSGNLVNNTANKSIDLAITGLPSGIWNGGSSTGNNWSDSANWNNTALTSTDPLNFMGTARLNNTNDLSFTETASYITFLPGAGAFTLNGNPVALTGGITNNSTSLQTINLGLSFGSSGTNFTFDAGTGGLIIGGGLTNSFGAPGFTTLTFLGTGILTNILNSSTIPGGTNTFLVNNANANWTLADNAASTPMTVPWDFQINAGTFNFGVGSSAPTLTNNSTQGLPQDNQVGNVSGVTGTLNMSNGTWTTTARLNTALANNSTGIVNQVGGTLNIGSQFQGANGGTTNAQSIVNLTGGTMNIGGGNGTFYNASRDQGSLTISGTAVLNCGNLDVSRNANGNARGAVGVINLNGGTLSVGRVGTAIANSQAGPASSGVNPSATFNFNGGTLKANSNSTNNSATFFQGSTVAPIIPITTIVKFGGAIIDDNGFAITVLEPLQHDATLGGSPDGGLIKKGSGALTLTAASSYTGATLVSNGTLVVNGSLGIGTVTVVNGATLAGVGSLAGDLTVNAGGTVSPGGNANIGTLTTSGNAVLQGNTAMDINASASLKDALNAGNITYGGTLTVTNLAGTPASGNSFKLFTAGSYSSNFAVTNLPALGAGLNWSWNPANGTLSVVSGVNPNPTNITASVSGNVLTLFWPLDHTGWTLQCQTNVLGAGLNPNAGAWTPVPGSTSVNTTNITIDPSQPTVFYRLKL